MLFPAMITNVLPRLVRFDLDFDLPEHVLPDPAPAIYLTTRPDLGDVAKGRLVTLDNYYEIFNGLLNPKQLEGLRLLVTQFPQQQFNATEDRRTDRPSLGVACFDCHANGHANGTNHLVGDIRPQEFRHRIETPTLRGVNVQRLRGIKDSPPYLHDGRCLTLEDTVEYFNLIQQLRLKPEEKADLVAFMRCL
jgi:cytochrome c peroxidase